MNTAEMDPMTLPQEENRGLELIGSHELAMGFAKRNRELGITPEMQAKTDELLWELSERQKDPRTADHGRRTGGYAGAVAAVLGFTAEQQGYIRVDMALHDMGKENTDPDTMHRSHGDEGYGVWNEAVDRPNILKHPEDGYNRLAREPHLRPSAKYVAGCHHQYPDIGQEAYGVPLSEIDREFADNEPLRILTHAEVFIANIVDKWDAASRNNSRFLEGSEVVEYMREYLEQYLPGDEQVQDAIIGALQDEQIHYLRAPQDTGYSPQAA